MLCRDKYLNEQTNCIDFSNARKGKSSETASSASGEKISELVDFSLGTVLELELIV